MAVIVSQTRNISPTKPFRILTRTAGQARTVISKGERLGFSFTMEPPQGINPYAVIFYPNYEGKQIMRLQHDKYMPGTQRVAYAKIKCFSFECFLVSKIRYKKRGSRNASKGIPVRAIDSDNNEMDFEDALEAIDWLHRLGFKKARRRSIYQVLSKGNNRVTAYGFKWKALERKTA